MNNQLPKKYVLVNTRTRKYFCGFVPTNKPVWVDTSDWATEYDENEAQQMKKRLACQSQNVILVIAKMICPACHKNLIAPGSTTCVECACSLYESDQ